MPKVYEVANIIIDEKSDERVVKLFAEAAKKINKEAEADEAH